MENEDFDHTHFRINIIGLSRGRYTKKVAMKAVGFFKSVSSIQLRERGESGE